MLNNSILRYKKDTYSDVLDEKVINLLSKTFSIPSDFTYQLVKVSRSMVARPDLISYHLYSDDGYGDLICKLNDIQNPFEMNEGMVLVCPAPSDLYRFFVEDTETDDETKNRPKPKRKSEKRKPNEATDGDIRYTVDSNKHIVVY